MTDGEAGLSPHSQIADKKREGGRRLRRGRLAVWQPGSCASLAAMCHVSNHIGPDNPAQEHWLPWLCPAAVSHPFLDRSHQQLHTTIVIVVAPVVGPAPPNFKLGGEHTASGEWLGRLSRHVYLAVLPCHHRTRPPQHHSLALAPQHSSSRPVMPIWPGDPPPEARECIALHCTCSVLTTPHRQQIAMEPRSIFPLDLPLHSTCSRPIRSRPSSRASVAIQASPAR